ncbi:MAG: hypothetical protein A2X86_17675 [Bdellovibrionales bacterium GWA2_49_15]|nr:MAG: hypothetical protein A2X86_17675 [Bdellovibrionales bacterium GWA2_49_15]
MDKTHEKMIKKEKKYAKELIKAWGNAEPLEKFLVGAVLSLYEYFHSNGFHITKNEWNNYSHIDSVVKKHSGWVYAFYQKNDTPLYVGETKRTLRQRFNEHQRSRKNDWWKTWNSVKVLPCEEVSSRKFFESCIGIAGGYSMNKLQPAQGRDVLSSSLLGIIDLKKRISNTSPLLRHHNEKDLIKIPHKHVCGNLTLIKSIYELCNIDIDKV